jgi:hypothetical protein
MNFPLTIFLSLVSGFLLYHLTPMLEAVAVAKNIRIRPVDIYGLKVTGNFPDNQLHLILRLNAENPTGFRAEIDYVELQIKNPANGLVLAQINTPGEPTQIKPKSQTNQILIPISLKLNEVFIQTALPTLVNLFRAIRNQRYTPVDQRDYISGIISDLPQLLQVEGRVRVNTVLLPINQSIPVIKQ